MNNLMAARSQMAMSLAFHIIFAVIGIGLAAPDGDRGGGRWIKTGRSGLQDSCQTLGKRGAAILFAVGAVSGTVLSFELGLLWPEPS